MTQAYVRTRVVILCKELSRVTKDIGWIRKDLSYYRSADDSKFKFGLFVEELQAELRVKIEHKRALLAQLASLMRPRF